MMDQHQLITGPTLALRLGVDAEKVQHWARQGMPHLRARRRGRGLTIWSTEHQVRRWLSRLGMVKQ